MRLAWIGLLLLACDGGSSKLSTQPQRPRDAAIENPLQAEGAATYMQLCAPCHGADGKGYKADNAPSLVNQTFLESATDDYLRRSIEVGRPGTSMPGYAVELGGPLNQAQIDRIVWFLRAKGPQAQPLDTGAVMGTTPKGDIVRGTAIYQRECQKCHGDAKMRVNAVHLANAQFLAVASDAFIRYAIVKGRPGTPMLAYQDKLSPQDVDDVVAYIRSYSQPPDAGSASPATPQLSQLPAPTGKEPIVINPKGKDPQWKKLRSDPGSNDPRYVSVDEVKQALADKRRIIIADARPPSDWMQAHAEGAVSIPYHDMKRLDEVPKDVWVIAYCACPHHLSGLIVDELKKRGHKRALILDEGILEWHRRGYPMTAAPGVKPPPKESPFDPHAGHGHGHDPHAGHGH